MKIKYLFILGLFLNPFISAGEDSFEEINPASTEITLENLFSTEPQYEPDPVEFNLSPQETESLMEEMAFKTSVVSAINVLTTVNSAIGFDVENPSPGRNRIAIPLAAGYWVLAGFIRRGLMSLSQSAKLNFAEYKEQYKTLTRRISETKKNIKRVEKELSAKNPAKVYAPATTAAEEIAEHSAEIAEHNAAAVENSADAKETPKAPPPDSKQTRAERSAAKKAEKSKTARSALAQLKREKRAELKTLRETLNQLTDNLKEFSKAKPKLYRTRKLLKAQFFGAAVLGSAVIYPLIIGDALLITFKADEDLYTIQREFERDINGISKALNLNIDSSDLK